MRNQARKLKNGAIRHVWTFVPRAVCQTDSTHKERDCLGCAAMGGCAQRRGNGGDGELPKTETERADARARFVARHVGGSKAASTLARAGRRRAMRGVEGADIARGLCALSELAHRRTLGPDQSP